MLSCPLLAEVISNHLNRDNGLGEGEIMGKGLEEATPEDLNCDAGREETEIKVNFHFW